MKPLSVACPAFTADPTPVVLAELAVRPLLPDEHARASQLLDQEHYLGAGQPVGLTLTQVVHHHGRWVALLDWAPPPASSPTARLGSAGPPPSAPSACP